MNESSHGFAGAKVRDAADAADPGFGARVKKAIYWRSGTQILSQLIMWGSTLAVIRILDPSDYGLFAMMQVVFVILVFMSGHSFASRLVQAESISDSDVRQTFGLLLLINVALAATQFAIAPTVADYYHQPLIADLLRWHAPIYLAMPFMLVPETLLSRQLEFKTPALVNLLSAVTGAATALGFALAGMGVWTLIAAPLVMFWTRAIAYVAATRFFVMPSFDFRGAGAMLGFGSTLLVSNFFWTLQSQADIFIAGRMFGAHEVGLYAEALFLTQILASKFVPPLNEVAFPAYARLQKDRSAVAWSFLKAVRIIFVLFLPLYLGMAVTAAPLVETLFGEKWLEMAPFISLLALAMPFVTLQILFAPAVNALGEPKVTARCSIAGAVIMPAAFLVGAQYGATGLALAWLTAFPVLTAITFFWSKDVIGIGARELVSAIAPALLASAAMAVGVYIAAELLPDMAVALRLALLVSFGGLLYGAIMLLFARETSAELLRLVIRRQPPKAAAPAGG